MRPRVIVLAPVVAISLWASVARAQVGKSLPFSEQEDADGSFWVWLAYDQGGGLAFERVPAKELGTSPSFKKIRVSERQPGDIAAWTDLMALADGEGTLVLAAGRKLKLADVEKKRGPASWYRWQERRKSPEKVSRVTSGAAFEAVNPDSYVWLAGKESVGEGRFIVQFDRRPIRMMNGEDGVAALSLVGETIPPGTTARQHAEAVAKREPLPTPRITEVGGVARMEGNCSNGNCRVLRTVRVTGTTALMAVCALPTPLEGRLKPDCDAWLQSAKIDAMADGGMRVFRPSAGPPKVPPEAGEWDLRGLDALKHGRLEDAVAAYDKALAIAPDVASYLLNRGSALTALGRVEAAAADFEKAFKLKPELKEIAGKPLAHALLTRGKKRVDAGDLDSALVDFKEAEERDPAMAEPWAEEAYVYSQRRDGDSCVKAATEALKRDARSFEALGTRANCLVHVDRAKEALDDLNRAMAIRPGGQLFAARAETKARLGDKAGARSDALRAVKLEPALRGPLSAIIDAP